jgi:hypothetical protein
VAASNPKALGELEPVMAVLRTYLK